MRTTVDIEDDVLEIAKSMARHQDQSLGKAISDLIRKGIEPIHQRGQKRNGLRVIVRRSDAKPVTLEVVNKLRDE
jgi:hypothetical protein